MNQPVFARIALALLVAFSAICAARSQAATVVAPSSRTNQLGETNLRTVFASGPRTYQTQLGAAQFAAMPIGSMIDGVSYRLAGSQFDSGNASPPVTFQSWDLSLAQAAHPINQMSLDFAGNMANPVMVRSGPLSFFAGAFPPPVGGTPVWGPTIEFQNPYVYQGGDLVLNLSHSGVDLSLLPPGVFGLSISGEDAVNGYPSPSDSIRSIVDSHTEPVTYIVSTVVRFSFTPVPEPTSIALLASGSFFLGASVHWVRRRPSARRAE